MPVPSIIVVKINKLDNAQLEQRIKSSFGIEGMLLTIFYQLNLFFNGIVLRLANSEFVYHILIFRYPKPSSIAEGKLFSSLCYKCVFEDWRC